MESTKHFFLHCHHYTNICKTLLNTVEMINKNILNTNDDDIIEILFGSCKFSLERNSSTLKTLKDLINRFFEQKSIFCTIGFEISILFSQCFILFPYLILFTCQYSGSLNWIYTFSMLFGFSYFCLAFFILKRD